MEVGERHPDERVTFSIVISYCLAGLAERCTTDEILGMLDGWRAQVVEESGDPNPPPPGFDPWADDGGPHRG
jgi:hypothetical protein